MHRESGSGYPTIVVLILLLGGIQLTILGIIGEYLARMYIQEKHRPIYIEKKLLDYKKNQSEAEEKRQVRKRSILWEREY